MMKRKVKTKKLVNLKVKSICCPLLKKQMPDIEIISEDLLKLRMISVKQNGPGVLSQLLGRLLILPLARRKSRLFAEYVKNIRIHEEGWLKLVILGSNKQ